MKLIIDIPKSRYNEIASGIFDADGYFKTNLTLAFRDGTPIPDNATNGQIIQTLFKPNRVERTNVIVEEYTFDNDWWNAPYQKGGKG